MTAENGKEQPPRQPGVPSSGEGADSALEALKKKRVQPPPPTPTGPPADKR
jgi:hypothetical protein